MNSRTLLNRRKFLAGASATALSLPFLRALPSYAASGEDKRYLILAFTANGVVRHRWGVNVTGAGPSDFTFKDFLAPLTPLKNRVVVVDGLKNAAANGSHEAGFASLWSGVATQGQTSAGATIDQYLGAQLNAGTAYPTLEFMVRSPEDFQGKTVQTRMIYSAAGAPVDPRDDPDAALAALFSNVGSAVGGAPDPASVRLKAMRAKLFSNVDADLAQSAARLCSEDKSHLDALRAGFATLNARYSADPGVTGAACAKPNTVAGSLSGFALQSRRQIDLLAMSLACDFTRVASLQFSHALSPMVPRFLDINEAHHDISHQAPAYVPDFDNPDPQSLMQYAPAWDKLVKIGVYHAGEIAYLAQQLDQFPVGGGKTLLDQTVICWGSEIDNGALHDHDPAPFVLIGGGAGKLKAGGTFIRYPKDTRNHNDLLVTLAQIMGNTTQSYGDAALNHGPLAEILA